MTDQPGQMPIDVASLLSSLSTGAVNADGTATEQPMIMIVEDDPDIACSLTIRLQSQGMRTCLATDALTALGVANENEPDCAILDINMPGGNGFDVAKQLREESNTPDVPVVFLTASMRPDFKERAEALGASAFMTKPYDASALMAKVRELTSGEGTAA